MIRARIEHSNASDIFDRCILILRHAMVWTKEKALLGK